MRKKLTQAVINGFKTALILFIVFALFVVFFPVFYGARGPKKFGSCQSNLKQLGLGFVQYTQDYDEKFPSGLASEPGGTGLRPSGLGWECQLYTYVKGSGIFHCPVDTTTCKTDGLFVQSYGFNRNGVSTTNLDWNDPAKSVALFEVSKGYSPLSVWPTTSQIISGPLAPVGDGVESSLEDDISPNKAKMATGDIGGRPEKVISFPRHPAGVPDGNHTGADYLMGDGHVFFFTPDKVSSGTNAASSTSPQEGVADGSAAGTGDGRFKATFSIR